MKLAFLTSLFLFNLLELHTSGVEKDSAMGYISFDAQQVQGNFIPNIPNNVFLKNIFPYLYPLPPCFGALPFAEDNTYKLINKDWAQIQPSISDLFYYYHIVNSQLFYTNFPIYYCEDVQKALSVGVELHFKINLANFNFIKKVSNNMLPLVQNSKDEVVFNKYTSKQVIEKRIYYWFFFKYLLEHNFFDEWLSCYELALQYAREDKRDLKLISDRYEFDLKIYIKKNSNKTFKDLLDKFYQVKNLFFKTDNTLKTEDLRCKKIGPNYLRDIFNYIMKQHMKQQKSGAYLCYAHFKQVCDDWGILRCKEFIQCDIIISNPDLIEYMLPDIKNIIKKNDFSDDDVKTLYYYLLLLEKWQNNKSMILPVNIVLMLNNRLEKMFYHAMASEGVLIHSRLTALFCSQVLFQTKSQSFYDKFLSVKRIIFFSWYKNRQTRVFLLFGILYVLFLYLVISDDNFKFIINKKLLGLILSPSVLIVFMNAFEFPCYLFNVRFFNN